MVAWKKLGLAAGTIAMLAAAEAGASPAGTGAGVVRSSERFDVVIGSICIGDIPKSARRTIRVIQNGGDQFEDWELQWNNRSRGRPIIKFFRTPRAGVPGTSCREMEGELLLTGDVESIQLRARSSLPGNSSAPRIVIAPGELDLRIGRVHSGLAPIFGGVLDLAGSKAWVENRGRVAVVEGSLPQGGLEITSWARTVRGARLVLNPGDAAQPVDLSSRRQNIKILTPLDGSDTELLDGRLAGALARQTLPRLPLPSVAFDGVQLDAGQVIVERQGDATTLALEEVSLRFAQAALPSSLNSADLGNGQARIAAIRSAISPTADVLALAGPSVTALTANAADCRTALATKPLMSAARCSLNVTNAHADSADYTVAAAGLASVDLAGIVTSTSQTAATFRVERQNDIEHLTGRLNEYGARVGALRFQPLRALDMVRARLSLGSEIRIPIKVDVPAGSGRVTHEAAGGLLVAEGRLDELSIRGDLVLDLAAGRTWRLEVGRGDLRFKASSLVTHQPLVLGGRTQFADTAIGFTSQTDIVVRQDGGSGRILFAPALTTVLDPRLSLGRSREGVVFKAPARLDANANLSLDIADGSVDVESGRLIIENAEARVEPGKPATVGDIQVEDGALRFASLSAVFSNGTAHAAIRGLEVSAQRLSTVPGSVGGSTADQIAWSGRANELIRSAEVTGRFERSSGSGGQLRLEGVVVRDTCIALSDATLGRGTAFTTTGQTLRVCVETWSDQALRGELTFRNGRLIGQIENSDGQIRGSVDIPLLALRITSGTPKRPTGTGQLVTSNLDLRMPTPVEIKQRCIGIPDFQAVRAETRVTAAAVTLAVQIIDGAMSGAGGIAFARANLRSTNQYDCRTEVIDWKLWDAVKVKTDVPCPTIRKPLRTCRREITLVPEGRVTVDSRLRVYRLAAVANAADPRLTLTHGNGGTNLSICAGRMVQGVPVIVASYVFQPRTPVPGFDRFIGDLTGLVAAPFESMLLTGTATAVMAGVSFMRILEIKPLCT